jgi:hypothetical protein
VAVVVNHLHLSDPLTEETAQAFREFAPRIVDAGATAAQVLPVDDTHLVLILEFASAQDVALTTPVPRLSTNARWSGEARLLSGAEADPLSRPWAVVTAIPCA